MTSMLQHKISTPLASVLLLVFLVTLFLGMSFIALYAHQIKRSMAHHRKHRHRKHVLERKKKERAKEWAENVAKAGGMGVGAMGMTDWTLDEEHQNRTSSPELSRRPSREIIHGHHHGSHFPFTTTDTPNHHPGHEPSHARKGISIHLPFLHHHRDHADSNTHTLPNGHDKPIPLSRSRRSSQSTTVTKLSMTSKAGHVTPDCHHRPSYSKRISAQELRALLELQQERAAGEARSSLPNSRVVRH